MIWVRCIIKPDISWYPVVTLITSSATSTRLLLNNHTNLRLLVWGEIKCKKTVLLRELIISCIFSIFYSITRWCVLFSFSTVETTVVDNNDGSYSVSYTPGEPGAYSVWVCVKAQHVQVPNQLEEFVTTKSKNAENVVFWNFVFSKLFKKSRVLQLRMAR